jgi:UDP-glucose 4-epimerase
MRVLLTGGAGYVGSHVALALAAAGHQPILYDSLVTGHRRAALDFPLVRADVGDRRAMLAALREHRAEAVMHFAALIVVSESTREPARYYEANLLKPLAMLEAMREAGVRRLIFSSSAAVYGEPQEVPIGEQHPTRPVNPYGRTKLALEGALESWRQAHGLGYAALRYFNAAGADLTGRLGEDHRPETHLIPNVLAVALGRRPALEVYGKDYPTPDGTCIRDYVHVGDLAQAHLLALERLSPGEGRIYNLGNARGHSVEEVVAEARRVTGHPIPLQVSPRRPGDAAVLVASAERAERDLGWQRRASDLHTIVETAWQWHRQHPRGYEE